VKSVRYRSKWHLLNLIQFAISFIVLGILGTLPASPLANNIGVVASFGYFGFFVALWFYSKNEQTKPVPERIAD